ncbi:HlyD family secretion protein [Cytobacillus sp. Hz8]|uniref:HlyD family secretion protein n=1 Tax=Cytobacillus sp. Hz8 TaxID=3347168 RepID=UPI0035E1A6D4
MNMRRMVVLNIITLIILVGAGFGGFYFINQASNYVKTDNAKIDGQQIAISAPATGKLVDWKGFSNHSFAKNGSLGKVQVAAPTPQDPTNTTKVDIKAPTNLTVVANKAIANNLVAAGTPLAYAYDFKHLWVTANIKETAIQDIKEGQEVDIYVDAYENATLKGTVDEIGLTSASVFSLLPTGNSDANYTKVTQVVPVKISIDDAEGYDILPGMNVSVRIHK